MRLLVRGRFGWSLTEGFTARMHRDNPERNRGGPGASVLRMEPLPVMNNVC